MESVIEKIRRMDSAQLQLVMKAVEDRYAQIYPEWDVTCFVFHKERRIRLREVENILKLIQKWDLDTMG